MFLVCLRNSKKVSVARMEHVRERMGERVFKGRTCKAFQTIEKNLDFILSIMESLKLLEGF